MGCQITVNIYILKKSYNIFIVDSGQSAVSPGTRYIKFSLTSEILNCVLFYNLSRKNVTFILRLIFPLF